MWEWDSVVFSAIFGTFFFGVSLPICSKSFRILIRSYAFYGLDISSDSQFAGKLPFGKRLFMTHIWKNPARSQGLWLARWFLVWHYVHVISYIVLVFLLWKVTLHYHFFSQAIGVNSYVIGTLTYTGLIGLTIYIFIGALPVSVLLVLPWTRKMKWEKK